MRLWEKIFISTLVVFQIFFISSSIFLINRSFNLNLDSEINSALSEQSRLCLSLSTDIYLAQMYRDPKNKRNNFSKEEIDSFISTYLTYFKEDRLFINVTDNNGNKVINNFQGNIYKDKEEAKNSLDEITYVIRDVENKTYLFIDRKITLNDNDYEISYIKEISYIYANKSFMFKLLMKLNVFLSLILGVVMIILSKIITKPINRLIKSTKEISEGNFSERVSINTDDEIGLLAKNFNNMADDIEDKIRVLEEVSEDKQKFIDNLAHELRTPLTSIIGYADFLRTNKYDEKTLMMALNYIYSEGRRMERLAFKLMDLIILKKEDLNMEKVNVEELFCEISNLLIPKLKGKAINLKTISEDFSILMDKELIIILISNLIDNAAKASKSGDEICLMAYMNKEPIIEVKDMGTGIPKEDLEKIFEPFYMIDKSRDRRNDGAGLGLALCSKIAEIHNSKIQVESELNRGIIVRLHFFTDIKV